MNRRDLQGYAGAAGFGANCRNSHAVKLEIFATAVRRKTYCDAAELLIETAEEMATHGVPHEAIVRVTEVADALNLLAESAGIDK